MFARTVSLSLKPNCVEEFTHTIEKQVLPMLRKQNGFQDEITLIVPGGAEAMGISLWDEKDQADTYNRGVYKDVLKALANVIDGSPRVRTFEVSNSTFHKIAARIGV